MATQAEANALNRKTKLAISDFTENASVKACLEVLHNKYDVSNTGGVTSPGKVPFIVSDIIDKDGRQYVNLVQKGGGVLGIALVGYTYVLEQMGIRFLRLAGTSAGAINTGMMTVIRNKEDTKSETIVEVLCDLDFFKLVDGHPIARWAIKQFVSQPDFFKKLSKWIRNIVLILVALLLCDFLTLGLQSHYPWATYACRASFVLTGIYILLLGFGGAYLSSLMKRLKTSGFGVNPGDFLYDWIKGRFKENGVDTVSDLNKKAAQEVPGLQLRPGVENEYGLKDLKGDVTFITSELVTENKFQLPAMCNLFRREGEIDTLQPAGFIRASMSIPIFFESYFIKDIPCTDPEVKQRWIDTFNEYDPPSIARFVDGGILSNFPINLFYNPNVRVPRMPTFGIDLDDSKPDDTTKHADCWSFGGYMGRMFNTIRYYYDKDFLLKNKIMGQGIGKVPLSQFNWLNFFLKNTEKVDMFIAGAEAARDFLLTFDWERYKGERATLPEQITTLKSQYVYKS